MKTGEDKIVIGAETDDSLEGCNPVSIFCNARTAPGLVVDDAINKIIVNRTAQGSGLTIDNPNDRLTVKGTAEKQEFLSIGNNPISVKGNENSSSITGNATTDTLKVNGESVIFKSWKTYQVDMEKVKEIKDVNEKLNAIFEIFAEMKMTIQEYAMTDTLKKFCRER